MTTQCRSRIIKNRNIISSSFRTAAVFLKRYFSPSGLFPLPLGAKTRQGSEPPAGPPKLSNSLAESTFPEILCIFGPRIVLHLSIVPAEDPDNECTQGNIEIP